MNWNFNDEYKQSHYTYKLYITVKSTKHLTKSPSSSITKWWTRFISKELKKNFITKHKYDKILYKLLNKQNIYLLS